MRKFEYVKRVSSNIGIPGVLVPLPTRSTECSAGYDIYSPDSFILKPGDGIELLTGFKIYLEKRDVFITVPRSSYGRKGIIFTTTLGIIDADYVDNPENEGEVHLFLKNWGNEDIKVNRGDRISQGLIMRYKVTDDDAVKTKRTGGVGSTGVH